MASRTSPAQTSPGGGADPEAAKTEVIAAIRRAFSGKPHWGTLLLARTGLENGRPLTLQNLAVQGDRFGFSRPVTRERIRQVVALAERYLESNAPTLPWTHFRAAALAAQSSLPMPVDEFVAGFGYREVTDPRNLFRALGRLARAFALPFDFRLDLVLPQRDFLVCAAEAEHALATLRRLNAVVGGLYGEVKPVAAELGCRRESLVQLIGGSSRWEFLDEERRYFWRRPRVLPPPRFAVTGNRILTVLCVVFAGAKRAEVEDLARSLFRHRSLRNVPVPARVIAGIAEKSGLFEVRAGRIARGEGWTWRWVSEKDRALLAICARFGRSVTSRLLTTELVRNGLPQKRAWQAMTFSPFLIHTVSGIFTEVGRYEFVVEPEDIDRAAIETAGETGA